MTKIMKHNARINIPLSRSNMRRGRRPLSVSFLIKSGLSEFVDDPESYSLHGVIETIMDWCKTFDGFTSAYPFNTVARWNHKSNRTMMIKLSDKRRLHERLTSNDVDDYMSPSKYR